VDHAQVFPRQHEPQPEAVHVGGLGAKVIEVYFAFGRIYLDPSYVATLANSFNLYMELAWLIGLVATTTFGWGVIEISRETKCPNCHQNFMFTRKRRRITGQGVHRGSEVTNYKSDWSCDNCGYKEKNVPEVVEREIPEE